MKIILLLLIAASVVSCKKESAAPGQACYHCTFGNVNGNTPPPQDYCGDDGGTRQFHDAQGNDLGGFCVRK